METNERFVCKKYNTCNYFHNSCQSNNYKLLSDYVSLCDYSVNRIVDMNYRNFKVGDHVNIVHNCRHIDSTICTSPSNSKGKTGVIIEIEPNEFPPICVLEDGSGGDSWYHNATCLEHINKGFDPEDIINKSFGV